MLCSATRPSPSGRGRSNKHLALRSFAAAGIIRWSAVTCCVLALAACEADVGEVAVKVASGFSVPALAIAPDRFLVLGGETFKAKDDGSPTVLRQPPGPFKLLYERRGEMMSACTFNIRKDRVVTVTLRAVGREVKCDIME
jgi:hypothetical protein